MAVILRGDWEGFCLYLATHTGEHLLPGVYPTLTAAARMMARANEYLEGLT